MKKYSLIWALLLTIFFGGMAVQSVRSSLSQEQEKETKSLAAIFPEAESVPQKSVSPLHYKALRTDANGRPELLGIAFVTTDLSAHGKGYAGPVRTMVAVTPDGKISALDVFSHSETPSYVMELSAFLAQFIGRDYTAGLALGKDLDGITRATMTSLAISQSVREGLRIVAKDVLRLEVPADAPAAPPGRFDFSAVILPFLLYGLAVGGVVRRDRRLRWLALAGGFLYLGLNKSTMVSVIQIANIGLLKVPSFLQNPLWYMLIGLTLASCLGLGMVYCGSLCPFAGIQELLFKIGRRRKIPEFKFPRNTENAGRLAKFGVLLGVLLVSFILGKADPSNIEPYIFLFTGHATRLGWILVGFMLVLSFFHYRFWCRFLCPIGAFTGLLSEKSLFKIVCGDQCHGCEVCKKVCPTRAVTIKEGRPLIDYPECILCGECLEKCPKGTLEFSRRRA